MSDWERGYTEGMVDALEIVDQKDAEIARLRKRSERWKKAAKAWRRSYLGPRHNEAEGRDE